MSAAVVPLDPDSPAGIAAAERITQTFAEIWLSMNARRQQAEGSQSAAHPRKASQRAAAAIAA